MYLLHSGAWTITWNDALALIERNDRGTPTQWFEATSIRKKIFKARLQHMSIMSATRTTKHKQRSENNHKIAREKCRHSESGNIKEKHEIFKCIPEKWLRETMHEELGNITKCIFRLRAGKSFQVTENTNTNPNDQFRARQIRFWQV
jgi:hypothetical protein